MLTCCLSCGAIFVSAADEEGRVSSSFAKSGENVCREHTADNVAQMRYVVNVGKSTRN